jgi:hypothetical protein
MLERRAVPRACLEEAELMVMELKWAEASVAELSAPNGQGLLLVATAELVRAVHQEDGELVLFKRPCEGIEQAQRQALAYARAWLAGHTSAAEVYGTEAGQLCEQDLLERE